METETLRDLLLHRHQGRPGIVARPPCPRYDLGALWRLVGEGDAAVAFQRPRDFVAGLHLFDRFAAYGDKASPHHGRLADFDARGFALHEFDKRARVGAAHVEKKEAWRHAGLGLVQFGAHISVDERERDKRGEAKSE